MRQLNNKQFDTKQGANPMSHRIPSPPVSIKEDETMKHTKGKWYTYSYSDLDGILRHGVSSSNGTYIGEEMTEGDANLIASAPEMLEMLKTIKDIAQDNMPKSSAYLRHDSYLYNQDKVDIYELCKSISEKCHIAINKAGGE